MLEKERIEKIKAEFTDKRDFVIQVGQLLSKAECGVVGCIFVAPEVTEEGVMGDEIVQVHFNNGYIKKVNVSGDSKYAVILDVIENFNK